jgi:hypothetical protein
LLIGEAREIWEQIGNDYWGQAPYWNGYFNERYMLSFDIHYGEHFRTFVELKSGLNSFRYGGPRPIDEKNLDFQAAAEFQKILDHRGIVLNEPIGALAHLQIGRAYAMQGDTARAKAAYQDFLTLWKDADLDIPIFIAAKAEYAKLK